MWTDKGKTGLEKKRKYLQSNAFSAYSLLSIATATTRECLESWESVAMAKASTPQQADSSSKNKKVLREMKPIKVKTITMLSFKSFPIEWEKT